MAGEYDVAAEWRKWSGQAVPAVDDGSVGFGWWAQSVGAGLFALVLFAFLSDMTFKVGVVADLLRRDL